MGPRVVSLLPSTTETLRAWNADPIACSRFCEQPDLPHVGGTKDPDVHAIVRLRPDLVVMDEEENRREDADVLQAAGLDVFVTAVRAVEDVGPTLVRLAAAIGVGFDPPQLAPPADIARSAFVPIWRRPWMTINGDTYGSSLLHRIGVANAYADAGTRYPETSLEDAAARTPDVVLAPSEPYPFAERHREELDLVAPTRFVDGRDLFWWGHRTPGAIARLAASLMTPG